VSTDISEVLPVRDDASVSDFGGAGGPGATPRASAVTLRGEHPVGPGVDATIDPPLRHIPRPAPRVAAARARTTTDPRPATSPASAAVLHADAPDRPSSRIR
jgi:hypothetical protein